MPGLRRLFRRGRRQLHSEHGAIAAILAVVLSSGLLFGIGAIVIDIGQLAVEREELQSGADSASWKIAVSCAAKPADCTAAAQTSNASTYARKNAKDGQADVQFCLNNTSCPWTAPMSAATACRALPTPAAGNTVGKYVEVRTTTRTAANTTLVPPSFGKLLMGDSYDGTRVGACARVNWGPPAAQKVFALGISLCDFKRMTGGSDGKFYGVLAPLLNQTGLLPLLGLDPPSAGIDSPIYPASVLGCAVPFGSPAIPAGYVWLKSVNSSATDINCMINVNVGDSPKYFTLIDGLLDVLLGPTAKACAQKLDVLRTSKLPILVPIFDQMNALSTTVSIIGYASFVVTGYASLGGVLSGVGSLLSGGGLNAVLNPLLCLVNCIMGYFTRALVPTTNPQFGPTPTYDFGTNIIGRTG